LRPHRDIRNTLGLAVGAVAGRSIRRSEPTLMWVVKLGGSMARSPQLADWLALLAAAPVRLVIVPGGGPFADQVREAQARWRFGDAAAHRMAVLAMEQFGLLLAALRPGLRPAASRAAIRRGQRQGRVPVWLPSRMIEGRAEIPMSWAVTSDSLAAWLARTLGAERLLLVKSAEAPPGPVAAAELGRLGLLDDAFAGFIAGARFETWCLAASRPEVLAAALAGEAVVGTRITAD
jgi:dihydroneopterin aldolase